MALQRLSKTGTALSFGDFFIITSAGTVGTGLTVTAAEVPAALYLIDVANVANDNGWALVKGSSAVVSGANSAVTLTGNTLGFDPARVVQGGQAGEIIDGDMLEIGLHAN